MLAPLFPGRFSRFVGRIVLAGLLVVAAAAGGGVGLLLAMVSASEPLEEFEDYSPMLTSRIYDRTNERIVAEFALERRDFVPLSEVPEDLIHAFLAIEDERFYDHFGVSPWDVLQSAVANLQAGTIVRGASTITMQVARKTLREITDERNFQRKVREALAAMQIEARYPKDRILEFYINQIPMGNGLYGVQAAAQAYFGVPVEHLTLAQCATLAGIAALPERYNPRDALENAERGRRYLRDRTGTPIGPDDATGRRNLVLRNMLDLGHISREEYERARAEPMEVHAAPDRTNVAPYFVDLVRRQILSDPTLGRRALLHDGIDVRSTVDLELQALAERTLRAGLASVELMWQSKKRARFWEEEEEIGWRLEDGQRRLVEIAEVTPTGLILRYDEYLGDCPLPARLPYFHPDRVVAVGQLIDVLVSDVDHRQMTFRAQMADPGHIQGALVVMDNHTGDILALVGGSDWNEPNAGQWNRAILGGRQPGSCFKPFVFACALEEGRMTPATMIVDERVEYPTGPGQAPYVPRNYENRYFGPTTLVEALEHSRNVVTVRLTSRLGINTVRDFALRFDRVSDQPQWEIPSYINMGLGVHDVTPLELACAMTGFANAGYVVRPRAWTQIRAARRQTLTPGVDGASPEIAAAETGGQRTDVIRSVPEEPDEAPVMSPQTAFQVLYFMMQAVKSGTGQQEVGDPLLGREGVPEIAGKTGTTTGNIDAWFAGLTPDWSVVVFVGFDQNISLGPEMTGGRVAGPIWRAFMEEALRLRPPKPEAMTFERPPGLVFVDICSESGLLWSSACEAASRIDPEEAHRYERVPFVEGTQPREACPHTSHL